MPIREEHLQRLALIVARLPGLELSRAGGTPALSVDGKPIARLRSDADGWLAIRCERSERDRRVREAPLAFHVTEQYRDYPMVLIDLDQVDDSALGELIENAWRHAAAGAKGAIPR